MSLAFTPLRRPTSKEFGLLHLLPNLAVRHPDIYATQLIVQVYPHLDIVASINAEGRGASIRTHSYAEWTTMLNTGTLTVIDAPNGAGLFPYKLSGTMRARQERAWAAVAPLVKNTPEIYIMAKRRKMIIERARELGISTDTIRNWIVEYWQGGSTPSALVGKRNSCGRHRTEGSTSPGSTKLGRPRKHTPGVGTNVDERMLKYFRVGIARIFHKQTRISKYETYLKTIQLYLPDAVQADEKGKVKVINSDMIPTYRQFLYWLRKETDEFSTATAKRGMDYYQKTLRPLLGNSTADSIGPGYKFQVDATIADVYLLSRADRRKLVGRPVLYVVIDTWSRMIVGIYVGLENASWTVAMMALHNVTLDKVEYCKEFGIDIESHEWPNASLASTILGDRAEFISKHSTNLAKWLNIEVENTPPYRADWKAVVERSFGLLQAKFRAEAPGYVDKNHVARVDADYRLDAKLTLHEFTQIVIHSVLHHNNTVITGYPLDNEMVSEGVVAIPIQLWNWGIHNRMGTMKKHSQDKLLLALLPTDEASVAANGLLFLKRQYYSTELHAQKWFSKARGGRIPVTVSYHPHNLNTVLLHVGEGSFIKCTLMSDESIAQGLCYEEVMAINHKAAATEGWEVVSQLEIEMTTQNKIEDVIKKSIDAVEALGPDTRSKAERLSNMRKNRTDEKHEERVRQGGDGQSEAKPTGVPALPLNPALDTAHHTDLHEVEPQAAFQPLSVIDFDDDDDD
ncbi:transposase family protein [Janthinobacterium sp. FW305-128]|uniref:transposase family protein n=1 Tax=Janthinobacterium sp. FW305-128 TaxID=2775055 RepID=UPI001E53500C|nr:transposase family protein [Janthinobacterium sp. FW305-128]MCC7682744.1 DDE-type integrase/transposase/recombinase [Janthinobacterium sp. FW305-128]